jgi:hypothetical protein
MGVIDAIENSAFAVWVRESPSIFAYTTILALHAMGLAIVVGLNVIVSLRLLGFGAELPLAPMRKLFPWMYLGFTINALSGLALLAANASNDLGNWMFLTKLTLILLAMVNLELTRPFAFNPQSSVVAAAGASVDASVDALRAARVRAVAVGALVLWSGAIVAGRLTEYPAFVRKWFGF